MDTFTPIAALLVGIPCVWFSYSAYYREPFSVYRFTVFVYALMLLGGVALLESAELFFVYKMPLNGLDAVFVDALIGFGILNAVYLTAKWAGLLRSPGVRQLHRIGGVGVTALMILAAMALLAIFLFIGANGIKFGNVDYEYRYDSSRGWGPILFFLPGFLPLSFYLIYHSKTVKSYLALSAFSVGVGFATYVALAGYRQILIATILISGSVAIQRGYVRRWHFLPGVIVALFAITILSFARYSGDAQGASAFDSPGIAAFYYIQGDVFPVDAPLKIQNFFVGSDARPGLEVVMNHLAKFAPRALWENKPALLLDAAGYYTQVVVGYERGITLSPTVMGEGYLVGGSAGFYVMTFIGAIMAVAADAMAKKSNGALPHFVCAFTYAGFFFIREGLSELIYRFIFVAVIYGIFRFAKLSLQGK